jgi:hypothetical protein
LIGQKTAYKQLSDHTAKLENNFVSQEELKAKIEAKFGKEKSALEDRIKVLSNATFLIREQARKTNGSDVDYKGDKVKFLLNEIRFKDGPPVGYVLIFDDGRVVSKIYNHEIKVNTVVSRNEKNGNYSVLSNADYVLKSPSLKDSTSWTNKEYPLKITGGQAFIDPTEPNVNKKSFYLWAPHYNLGITTDLSTVYPVLSFSVAGYGYSKRDLDFKFLDIGGIYKEDKFKPYFAPVMWRPLPNVLSNTYIGPALYLDKSAMEYLLTLHLTF